MSAVTTDQEGTNSPSGPPPVRRLTRRADHRVLAGVAGGLADYFAIDPIVFRIAFVVLALTGGAGLLLYVLGWILIPREDLPTSAGERLFHRAAQGPSWLAVILVLVGAIVLLSHSGFWAPSIVWGLALIAVGIVLYTRDREPPPAPVGPPLPPAGVPEPSEASGTPASQPAYGMTTPAPFTATQTQTATPPMPPARFTPITPRPPRERSVVGWFVMGAVLAAVGVAAMLDQMGAISLRPVQYMALALTIMGVGLLVSAWIGRARWLILPCLLLLPFVAGASLIHVPIQGGFGDHTYAPVSLADVKPEYRLAAGQLTIDLTAVNFGVTDQAVGFAVTHKTVRASVVAGTLEVIVPRDVRVALNGSVGAGTVSTFAGEEQGANVPVRGFAGPPGAPLLTLDLDVSFGQVSVIREAPALGTNGSSG